MIPYGKQYLDSQDIAAVVRVLNSDYLTTGPEVERFEHEFAQSVGAKFAVAVSSGTAALHLAMLAANIGEGDRVLTSPNTFLASANASAFVGATPDFVDIDPQNGNMDPSCLADSWKDDVRAIVAVDYAGRPCNMPAIAAVAREHGAVVIEDGCHALGSRFYSDGSEYCVGGHPWADMTTFSFHPVKTMTTGEGGMLVTDNEKYAERARLLRSHGMVRDPEKMTRFGVGDGPELGPWVYEMQDLGYNYRITDIQCALGRSQLSKLDSFADRRREIVDRYNEAFESIPFLTTPKISLDESSAKFSIDKELLSWHLYTLRIDFAMIGMGRADFMNTLRREGIGSQVLYIPVYWQPWYRDTFGHAKGMCPNAEKHYEEALSLPLYYGLQDAEVDRVIEAVCRLCGSTESSAHD